MCKNQGQQLPTSLQIPMRANHDPAIVTLFHSTLEHTLNHFLEFQIFEGVRHFLAIFAQPPTTLLTLMISCILTCNQLKSFTQFSSKQQTYVCLASQETKINNNNSLEAAIQSLVFEKNNKKKIAITLHHSKTQIIFSQYKYPHVINLPYLQSTPKPILLHFFY